MTQTIYNSTKTPVSFPTTAANASADPFDAAMNPARPESLARVYFGEVVTLDPWFCVLEKGKGKRPFDPTSDAPERRTTAITIKVAVARRDGSEYTVDQETVDFAKDWTAITLPSLRKLGITLRELKGAFVQVQRTNTGETYVGKDGTTRDRQGLEFMAVFPDRDAMKAAADLFYTPRGQRADASSQVADDSAQVAPAAAAPAQPAPLPVADAAMREYAKQILPALWSAAKQDKAAFLAMISSNPMISAHFNAGSEEVCLLTGELPF